MGPRPAGFIDWGYYDVIVFDDCARLHVVFESLGTLAVILLLILPTHLWRFVFVGRNYLFVILSRGFELISRADEKNLNGNQIKPN
jgi:hypothetical protein